MSHITCFEAKQIAAYLKESCSLVSQLAESPKHGQWLNAISRSCGFRDWNAMAALSPGVPVSDENGWFGAFFGIARVVWSGEKSSEHLVWFRNRDSSRHAAAVSLAKSVGARLGERFCRLNFSYSQPDSRERFKLLRLQNTPYVATLEAQPVPPIVATSQNGEVTIQLWWLSETYSIEAERQSRFQFGSLRFDDDGSPYTGWASEAYNPESLTDNFLNKLTGAVRPKRSCLYVPRMPNGPASEYFPLTIEEGARDGKLSELNLGDDWFAAHHYVKAFNLKNGLTSADVETITRRFQELEPHEEEYFDEFGALSESDSGW